MSGRPKLPPIPPGYQAASSQMLDDEPSDAAIAALRDAGVPDELTVVTWNVEWATPRRRRDAIRERLAALDADVIVLTEGDRGVLPEGGQWIDGGGDWGYRSPDPERRKVILWSKHRLLPADALGLSDGAMPPGRLAAAKVVTTRGLITFFAVCIPWRDAHVRTGRADARPWDEHIAYLQGVAPVFGRGRFLGEACILGDFNQRIPRHRAPEEVHAALMRSLMGYTVVTEGHVPGLAEPVVDHIATTPGLEVTGVAGIDRHEDGPGEGRPLSDHHLVMCRLSRNR